MTLVTGSRLIVANEETPRPAGSVTIQKEYPGEENYLNHTGEIRGGEGGPRMMRAAINGLNPEREDLAHHHVLTARDSSGKLVGAIRYSHEPNGYDEIPGDHVHVHFLGTSEAPQGTGKKLLMHAVAHAADKGTGVGLSSLPGAMGFYKKHGLEHTGEDMYGLKHYTATARGARNILKIHGPEIRSLHD